MILTQEQYLILQQSTRQIEAKIELLNEKDIVMDMLQGIAISGNINIQSGTSYRRHGSLKLIINDKHLLPKPDSKIWFNRKIRIFIGMRSFLSETIWFNQGVFVIQDVLIDTSNSERSLSINFSDLMGLLDGSLNGNLTHEVKITPEGVKVEEALRATLSSIGKLSIDEMKINDADVLVPYEISSQPNSSIYDLSKQLLDLYMGMEMYFNEEGFLIIQKIKDRRKDPILWDFTAEGMNLTISHTNKFDFANVRNSIQVWGRKKNTGETIKWSYRNRFARENIYEMENITEKEIGDICHIFENETSYVWDNQWLPLDFLVSPDFRIEKIGEKSFAYTDEKIAIAEQAILRAEYELNQRNNFAEKVSLTCIPLFGMEVNSKIRLNESDSGIEGDYIVKRISVPLSFDESMNIEAEKIYY